jgi:hypothetical protein
VIRINLLPRAHRRRRLRLRREVVSLAAMLLGWALVTGLGYAWIAGHSARAADLRAARDATRAEIRLLEKKRDNPALAERQRVLKIRQDGLRQLRAQRQAPAVALSELAALFAAGETSAGEPVESEDPGATLTHGEPPALRVLELRAPTPERWRVDASARDVAALAELVRRLRAGGAFHLSYGPEYAQAEDGRLRFRVDLRVGPQL